MTREPNDTLALVKLVSTAYSASQASLSSLARREAALRDKLEALSASRGDPAQDRLENPANRAGADILYQRWVDSRRSELNLELARTIVAIAQAKSALARAFGRHEAIKAVHKVATQKARTAVNRRAERDG